MRQIILMLGGMVFNSLISCNNDNELIKEDYSISFPTHLELDESKDSGAEFVLMTQKTSENDDFVENINLTVQGSENLDFTDFVKILEKEIKSVGKIIESKKVKTDNSEYQRMIFSVIQNNVQATFIQHGFVENNKAYVLTFSCKSAEFDDYYDEMNEIMLSFNIN